MNEVVMISDTGFPYICNTLSKVHLQQIGSSVPTACLLQSANASFDHVIVVFIYVPIVSKHSSTGFNCKSR